jgi:hypothetical protein
MWWDNRLAFGSLLLAQLEKSFRQKDKLIWKSARKQQYTTQLYLTLVSAKIVASQKLLAS